MFIEKNLYIRGPVQFKYVLFQESTVFLKKLIT